MISETLAAIAQVGVVAFVVTSMLGLGMSLSIGQIVGPLRNARLLIIILLGNFVAVPLVAWLVSRALPMDRPAETAMILLGTMAGAPFLPKLAQLTKGDVPLAVGTMVLLMVVTIAYAPIVVPLLLEGVEIEPWDIAKSLLVLMLLPLALGLLFRGRYPETAEDWSADLTKISSVALMIGIAAGVLVAWEDIFDSIGSWIFIGTAVLAVASVAIGWFSAFGDGADVRKVTGFGAAQRNLSAALLVAGTNFDADTLVMTMVASLGLSVILIVAAGEFGKRAATPAVVPESDIEPARVTP